MKYGDLRAMLRSTNDRFLLNSDPAHAMEIDAQAANTSSRALGRARPWRRASASECDSILVAKKAAARGAAGFTALQGQYLAFIRAYSVIHGVAPADADMQRFFRVSAPSCHQMVVTLEHRASWLGFLATLVQRRAYACVLYYI
jgi:hypothetical protein